MTEVQAAEIDSYCQGNAFFRSAHHGWQGIPAKMGGMGVGGGNDSAIIRWQLPVMARNSGPRRASASAHPLFSYARKRHVEELEKEWRFRCGVRYTKS